MRRFITVLLALLPLLAQAVPDIQHWATAKGARVYFVQAPEIPMLDIQLTFDAGAARDGEKFGLAKMVNATLAEGAAGKTADAIAEQFASLGARFGNSSLKDMSIVELRSLTDSTYLNPALGLLADIVARPDFNAPDLERIRQQMLTGIKVGDKQPGTIVQRQLFEDLYGTHPYAHPTSGTAASVAALTRADVVAFHKRYFVAKNLVIAMIGDIDKTRAAAIAEQLTANMASGAAAPSLPAVTAPTTPLRTIAHDSQQTQVRLGMPLIERRHPDFYALYVANHILGGSGLVSRLSEEVREQRGLSYSVYSYIQPMRQDGPFIIGLQTRNDRAWTALAVVQSVLHDYVASGPTQEEFDKAVQNITGGFPLRINSNSKIAEYLSVIGFYDLPLDYLDNFNQRIRAVSLADVRRVLREHLREDKLRVILVGGMPPAPADQIASH